MRRSLVGVAALACAAALAAVFAASAGAYGGGASHDTWQIAISSNCNNPDPSVCGGGGGGFWGWVEFDRFSDGTITGDAQLTGCGHSGPGGGPHSAGAGHFDIDITSAHIGPSQPGDPNYPSGQTFYVDSATVNGVVGDTQFLGDTQVPVEPGHYTEHIAPGEANLVQVSYRAAK